MTISPDCVEFAELASLGFLVGAYGTLVGAGGGSLLVPALLMLMPAASPSTVTAMSLVVVFFNAYSGTLVYVRMKRIDYFAGLLFAVSGIPGAILGAMLVHQIPRALFEPLFGVLLLALGGFLVFSPVGAAAKVPGSNAGERWQPNSGSLRFNTLLGAIGSAYIAVLSSLLGIGGGIIHVPFLIRALHFPAHIATATSHFVLTFMALTAVISHLVMGEIGNNVPDTMYLAVGVMMGAPLGAALSTKIHGSLIVRLLAVALCLVGVRLLAHSF